MSFSAAVLRSLLACDPERGELVWQPRSASMFETSRAVSRWNACYAGKPAFDTMEQKGYKSGKLSGKRLKAHRVIWAWVHDEWPDEIDHINGDKTDNRISNLRGVDHAENSRNRKLYSNNTNGSIGVFQRPSGRWGAHINADGKRVVIGTFDTKELAAEARRKAELEQDYHPNHGRIQHG